MRTPILPLGAASIIALGGCSVQAAGGDSADAEASTQATAVVVVERTAGPGDAARAEAVARFVQMRAGAVDDQALRMVGAAVDFPAVGACAPAGAARPLTEAPARAVKLADVGVVFLEANGVKTNLVARQVPDVADLVSGVVYTARAEASLAPRTRYVLRSGGTAEIDAFDVAALAPSEPAELQVGNQDGHGAIALAPSAGAELTWAWEPSDDLVYVDIASSDSSTPVMRCLFGDTGHATVPASAFGAAEQGTISVHRLHREAFRARGLDSGEIRFDFARTVAFTRR
jgi:hypothetical protein